MKKLLYALPIFLSLAFGAFAEGEAAPSVAKEYSGSVSETVVDTASDSFSNFLEGTGVVIVRILGVVIAIWFSIAIVGDFKKAFSGSSRRYDDKSTDGW